MKSGTLLRQVVEKINESIDFNQSRTRHLVLAICMSKFLKDLQSAGMLESSYAASSDAVCDRSDQSATGEKLLEPGLWNGWLF
jgi:type I restriction enzyme M protein